MQTAAEAFAARNNGVYPANVGINKNLDGNTLIDLLPGGASLENPFTNILTEPTNGTAAILGATGWVPIVVNKVNAGYDITGWGIDVEGRCQKCGTRCAGVFEPHHGNWGSRRQPVRLASYR